MTQCIRRRQIDTQCICKTQANKGQFFARNITQHAYIFNAQVYRYVKRVCLPVRGSLLGLGVFSNIELYIARKRGTLNKHLSKWKKLINTMGCR